MADESKFSQAVTEAIEQYAEAKKAWNDELKRISLLEGKLNECHSKINSLNADIENIEQVKKALIESFASGQGSETEVTKAKRRAEKLKQDRLDVTELISPIEAALQKAKRQDIELQNLIRERQKVIWVKISEALCAEIQELVGDKVKDLWAVHSTSGFLNLDNTAFPRGVEFIRPYLPQELAAKQESIWKTFVKE